MIKRGGFFWPDDDRDAHGVILRDVRPSIAALLEHVPGRACIVQAGGNVGVYPAALARLFDEVVTAEPDAWNAACLLRNLVGVGNITSHFAGFGEISGNCRIVEVSPQNCGAHRIDTGGDVPVITIDSLSLQPDCIWLDIEGYELRALKGARQTIEAHHPVICVEQKGLCTAYGERPEDLREWLSQFGYVRAARIGNDYAYV